MRRTSPLITVVALPRCGWSASTAVPSPLRGEGEGEGGGRGGKNGEASGTAALGEGCLPSPEREPYAHTTDSSRQPCKPEPSPSPEGRCCCWHHVIGLAPV